MREQLAQRARRALAPGRAAGDDGHELARVVALHARDDRARGVARGDQPRWSSRGCSSATPDGPPWIAGRARRRARGSPAQYTLGLASSSNRELIDLVLEAGGIAALFRATVSSEEVARGKPAPDVYLEAARRLGVDPAACAAIEDSHNGIRSAKAAGMACVAIPNPRFPPGDAVAEADARARLARRADGRDRLAARTECRAYRRPAETTVAGPHVARPHPREGGRVAAPGERARRQLR